MDAACIKTFIKFFANVHQPLSHFEPPFCLLLLLPSSPMGNNKLFFGREGEKAKVNKKEFQNDSFFLDIIHIKERVDEKFDKKPDQCLRGCAP